MSLDGDLFMHGEQAIVRYFILRYVTRTNKSMLFKRGDDFGLYEVLNFGYRTRVQNIQNALQNELFNKNAKAV
jgi:hypothetical protein